jgi:hypothetical protein
MDSNMFRNGISCIPFTRNLERVTDVYDVIVTAAGSAGKPNRAAFFFFTAVSCLARIPGDVFPFRWNRTILFDNK